MKKKSRYISIFLAVMAVILAVQVFLFLVAKPKVEVDYLAKINALSKPSGYDPNEDGLNYLMEASELYVQAPAGLAWEHWPHEMNDADLSLLKSWVAANSKALDAFKKASECDYIWVEIEPDSHGAWKASVMWPENHSKVRRCLFWRAKLKAFEGNFETALEDMLTAWRYGIKHSNPNYPLRMQISAISDRQDALDTAIDIVDVYKLPAADLDIWQKKWQNQFELDYYVPGLEAEKLDCYDRIQRSFVHQRNGTGKLYWKHLGRFVTRCEESGTLNFLLIPITGPTQSQARAQVDSMIARYKDFVVPSPWETKYQEQQYVQFQETINKMPVLDPFIPPLHSFTIFYHRVKMRQDALITILAILRFNSLHERYPSNLAELVQEGLLTGSPRDPFSSGPLMYNQLDDDFELYGVGPDFSDDGGERYQGGNPLTGAPCGDEVFWPPLRKGRKNIKVIQIKPIGPPRQRQLQELL